MNVTVLVDFDNDSVQTALAVASALGDRLWGVRLDTSERIVDRALQDEPNPEAHHGVTPLLAQRVRRALDAGGFEHVRIVVSGGFNPAKIMAFEAAGAPVDAYGVGSSLLRGSNDFTADVVRVDGSPVAKAGRSEKPNPALSLVE
jgi:nicotinate phosphoribosyltransferase